MRVRAVLGSIFASAAVLVIGWQAGGAVLASDPTSTSTASAGASGTENPTPQTATGTHPDATSESATPETATPETATPDAVTPDTSSAAGSDGTFIGSSVETRFGSVQVSVTIAGGAITDITAMKLTDKEGRSVQISNRAAPILREEVLAAQSADVSNVSGATYTSDAYLESVQSALDQAGL